MSNAEVQISVDVFARRVGALQQAWERAAAAAKDDKYEALRGVDAVLVAMGGQNEEVPYSKTASLHIWLLGYEFPSTLLLLTRDSVTFLTSASKAKLLEPLRDNRAGVPIDILKRSKDDAANQALWKELLAKVHKASSGKRVGVFSKDKPVGKFGDEWSGVWAAELAARSYEAVDVGPAFAAAWAVKDAEELKLSKTAARMTTGILKEYFVDEMSTILDEGKKTTHEKLAAKIEEKLEDDGFWKKQVKGLGDADIGLADWCYTPIIQSGGEYDLRTSASSNEKRLEGAEGGGGVVIASMGLKYKSYCANIGRTYLIDPHKRQSAAYALLLEAQHEVCENILRAGVTCKEVYARTLDFIRSKDAKLADKFVKTMGFAIGIEFRDSSYLLSPKCARKLRADMTFNLSMGFADLPDPNDSSKVYALLLVDTVKVNEGPASYLTERVKSTSDLSFFKDEDEEEDGSEADVKVAKSEGKSSAKGVGSSIKGKGKAKILDGTAESKVTPGGKVLRNKTRGKDAEEAVDKRIAEHQRELARQRHEDGLARFENDGEDEDKANGKTFKKFESYKRDHMLPTKAQDLKVSSHSALSICLLEPLLGC